MTITRFAIVDLNKLYRCNNCGIIFDIILVIPYDDKYGVKYGDCPLCKNSFMM